MMNFKFGLCSFIFSLMLGVAPAWADVDISGKERVEVGSWSELKAAVQNSANAGKVIVLTGDIQADKDNPITSVGGSGIIIDGGGHTITGQEGTSGSGQFINFDSSDKTDLIVQNINLKGFGNVKTGSYYKTNGGAIYNEEGTIGDISGDFSSNYAYSSSRYSSASGGAIANDGTIGDINGDFTGNYAISGSYGDYSGNGGAIYNTGIINNIYGNFKNNYTTGGGGNGGAIFNSKNINNIQATFNANYSKSSGGAIYNSGIIGDITGDFIGNYLYNTGRNYSYGARGYTYGGAIYNSGTIGDINGDFSGNYAQSYTSDDNDDYKYFSAQGGAIYNSDTIGNIRRFIIVIPSVI